MYSLPQSYNQTSKCKRCISSNAYTYDKIAEIKNSSGKDYILNYYGNPQKLYRTEVHLNNQEIKDYLENRGLYFNYYMIDEAMLEDMFYYHLNSVIRFEKGKDRITWENLCGKVAA